MAQTDIATSEAPSNQDAHSDQMERLVGVGVGWKLGGQVFVQGIRLATVAILARLLTPADYGAAAIAIALAMFAPTVADMGMGSALVQIDEATQRVRSTTFWAALAFGIGLSALLAASAAPVGRFLGDPQVGTMVAVGGLTFAICSIGSTSQAVFMREMRFRSIELRYWFAIGLASAIAVFAAAGGAGPWALVLQQIVLLDHVRGRALVAHHLAPDPRVLTARPSVSWAPSRSGSRGAAGRGWPSCSPLPADREARWASRRSAPGRSP